MDSGECKFLQDSVEYYGHLISATGLRRADSKVRGTAKMPQAQDVKQLWSFLGMVQYYVKYLPDLASHLAPLHQLLRKGTLWTWETVHESTFNALRTMLLRDTVLTHFNSSLEITLSCDSPTYVLGAVPSHQMSDCGERPIAHVS